MKTLACAFMAMLSTAVYAQEEYMIVQKQDGTEEKYSVADVQKVYFYSEPTTTAEAVDLGLTVKWASCNVGATAPEEYGGHYAWGETEEKEDYSEATSTTFNVDAGADIAGTEYDVAHVKWGGAWRLPTKAEWQELVDECTWTWTSENGVNGYKVTGPNDNSIFLPAAGCGQGTTMNKNAEEYGYYWGSTAYEKDGSTATGFAAGMFFSTYSYSVNDFKRTDGRTVRPVAE